MAQNETIALALEAQPVPEDRECVRSLSEILKGAQDYLQVIGDGTAQPGQIFPSAVVIAEKALALANEAIADVAELELRIPERRTSQELLNIPVGDSTLAISWTPDLPSTNYEVRVTFFGAGTSSGDTFCFRVIDGSRTTSGCQLRILNITANTTKLSWVAEAL